MGVFLDDIYGKANGNESDQIDEIIMETRQAAGVGVGRCSSCVMDGIIMRIAFQFR